MIDGAIGLLSIGNFELQYVCAVVPWKPLGSLGFGVMTYTSPLARPAYFLVAASTEVFQGTRLCLGAWVPGCLGHHVGQRKALRHGRWGEHLAGRRQVKYPVASHTHISYENAIWNMPENRQTCCFKHSRSQQNRQSSVTKPHEQMAKLRSALFMSEIGFDGTETHGCHSKIGFEYGV